MGTLTQHSTEFRTNYFGTVVNKDSQQELTRKREYRAVIAGKALEIMNKAARPEELSATTLIAKLNIPRNVFKHLYDSVDDFQDDLIDSSWKELMRQLRLVATRISGREGLDEIISTYRRYVKENRGSYYLAACQGRDTPVGRKYVSRLGRLLHIVLASCDLGHDDLHRSSQNLADVLHGLAVMEITGETYGEVDTTVTIILRAFLNGLFHEIK